MTKIVGLTGGIGSGKTTIANYFQSLGIPVYIADVESKKLMQSPEILTKIEESFGGIVFENGVLSKEKLASIVFNNQTKLDELNAIVHPAVEKHFKSWLVNHSKSPLIIKEAAILFETGSYKDCNSIITVVAPLESRIQRVIDRDKSSRKLVLQRISKQWSDDQRILKSNYIIENSNIQYAQQQARNILEKLTNH